MIKPPLTDRVAEAFAFANELHREQRRKGSGVPYLTHLMAVSALVGEYGGAEDEMVAALLHDAVEDQGGKDTLARIRERFGDRVAFYVDACSDCDTVPKPPWRQRKEAYVAGLASHKPEVKLISAADKLHNTRSMLSDYRAVGDALWDRFHANRDEMLWYLRSCIKALSTGWSHRIVDDLGAAVDALETMSDGQIEGQAS